MSAYATTTDIAALWRPLTVEEAERAEALLPLVSDLLRQQAHNVGKDLDKMIACDSLLRNVAKAVTVDVTARVLRQNTSGEPVSQESQSGLGYSWSGTYAVPGGGIANAIMNSDLKKLGLLKQRAGVIEFYDSGRGNPNIGADPNGDGWF